MKRIATVILILLSLQSLSQVYLGVNKGDINHNGVEFTQLDDSTFYFQDYSAEVLLTTFENKVELEQYFIPTQEERETTNKILFSEYDFLNVLEDGAFLYVSGVKRVYLIIAEEVYTFGIIKD